MQALQDRLKQLENPTGSDIWDILKSSENDLQQDLESLRIISNEKEQKNRKTLETLEEKKRELLNIKKNMESLKNEYQEHIETVESSLKANGLEMKQVVEVFEKVLADSLSEKKSEILEILSSKMKKSEIVEKLLEVFAEQPEEQLKDMVSGELLDFYSKSVESFRLELWSLLQKQGVPIKSLEDTSDRQIFMEKLNSLCQFSTNLDKLHQGNHSKSVENIVSAAFGQLVNICVDMIDNEKGDADFEWILTCGHKWAKNLKKVMRKAIDHLRIDEKYKKETEKQFNDSFVTLIHTITQRFLTKNLKDPLVFCKMSQLFRRFQDTCDEFDLTEQDLFKPFYEPEVMSKWILLEVEMFTFSANQLFSTPECFDPLSAIFIGTESSSWASEVTIFFEEWLIRIDKDVSSLGDFDVQLAFYEALQLLILDVCSRIHVAANVLYVGNSWSNDVYLVMNTLWELRRMIRNLTITWPIPSFEMEKTFEKEWNRLAGMISEYLGDIVDSMDKTVRSTYCSTFEKEKIVTDTFYHVIKCLRNVTRKASKPSRSALLNYLLAELFANLQRKFDKMKNNCSIDVLGCFYTQIYTCLLPHLDALRNSGNWTREDGSRSEICRLDALMKSAANRDPSGELVRTAFKSIDEEQVIKMLAELGIYSTSDHAFQDYQILAENWEKIKDKGY